MDIKTYKTERLNELKSRVRGCSAESTKIEYCTLAEELFGLTPSEAYQSLKEAMKINNKKWNEGSRK